MPVAIDLKQQEVSKVKIPNTPLRKISLPKDPEPKKPQKTTSLKKTNSKWKKIVGFLVILLVLAGIGIGGTLLYKAKMTVNAIGGKVGVSDIFNPPKDPQLKKDSTGKFTNVLLIGIDTRPDGSELNTDTIMVASYNYETEETVMISIPRDFYVEVPGQGWYTKINGVYSRGENEDEGIQLLKQAVEEVTGLEIQYYGMVNLQAFVQIIDTVGGLDINVERSFEDYGYPDDNMDIPVVFEAGPQTMDGETALKYARSRHSYDPIEGTDFARARRQQKVIVATKEKVLSTGTFLNPKKILDLMSAVEGNVRFSEWAQEDLQAGIKLAKKSKDARSYSFVLDFNAGNGTLLQENREDYTIFPTIGYGNYTDIQEYIKSIQTYPKFYAEAPLIMVYDNGIGYEAAQQKALELQAKYPYSAIIYQGTLNTDKTGTIVYSHEDGAFPDSIKEMSAFFGKKTTNTKPDYVNNLNAEDITILLGAEAVTTPAPQN